MRTIEQMVLAFLTERRLKDAEAREVLQLAKKDSRFSYLEHQWGEDEATLSGPAQFQLKRTLRKRVIAWMDKFEPKHSARALFTGES